MHFHGRTNDTPLLALNLTHNFCKIRHGEGGGVAETLVEESDYAAS